MAANVHSRSAGLFLSSLERQASLEGFERQPISLSNREIIAQHLCEAEKALEGYDYDLERCNSEINRLRAHIMTLEWGRRGVLETVEKCKSLLAPVNRLPPEILKEIFMLAASTAKVILDPIGFSETPTPTAIVLSMVCGRWRDLSLSLRGLWSSIHLSRDRLSPITDEHRSRWDGDEPKKILRAVQLLLRRSGDHPLDLEFSLGDTSPSIASLNSIFMAFAAESKRWRSVTLSYCPNFSTLPAFRQIRNNLPILRAIILQGTADCPFDFLVSCPSLETVKGIFLHQSLQGSPLSVLPWANIRNLDAIIASAGPSMQSLLRACPNLRQCSIFPPPTTAAALQEKPVQSDIESLSLIVARDGDYRWCGKVTFPRMRDLRLQGGSHLSDIRPLLQCLERSSADITSLTIVHLDLRDEKTLEVLHHIPSLQKLHITEKSVDKGYTRPIITSWFPSKLCALSSTSTHLVPKLTDLSLIINGKGFDGDMFAQAIISRWLPNSASEEKLGVACLKSVDVQFLNGFDKLSESFLALRCYRDAGLRISLTKYHRFTPYYEAY